MKLKSLISGFRQKIHGKFDQQRIKRGKLRFVDLVERTERPIKRALLLTVDLVLIAWSYIFMLVVVDQYPLAWMSTRIGALTLALMLLGAAGIAIFLKVPNIRLNSYGAKGMGRVGVMAALIAAMGAALHQIADSPLDLRDFVIYALALFVFLALARLVMLDLLTRVYRMRNERCRVLIYGAGSTGMQLAHALMTHDRIEPVAFVDDQSSLQKLTIAGLPVLRPVDIESIVAQRNVQRVLLAMPSLSRPKQAQIARRLEAAGLEVQALPSFSQLIGTEPLIDKLVPLSPKKLVGRKTFDRRADLGCQQITGRSVCVTGGGGSIGSELCRQVLGCNPRKLVIFELSELALYEVERSLAPLAVEAGVELVAVLGSVTETRLVRRVLGEHAIDVVLHAAAYKHVNIVESNPLVGLANNVLGTWTMAREAAVANIERFILISSDKAVRPTNIMGASKRLAELVVQDQAERAGRTVFSMVRFGNVIGSSGSVIPLFKEQIARGGPVTVTHRDVTRYFMTSEEAVSLVLVASSMASGGEVFVLDMGRPIRIWDMAEHLIQEAAYTVRTPENPDGDIAIEEVGLRPGEKLHEELMIGEGHITTSHEKIFCAREACLSEIEVASAIRALREALASGDEEAALAVARRWVEGYGALKARNA